MAVAISSFVNATAAKYVTQNLNSKRQRLFRLLALASNMHDVISGPDYMTTDTAAKSLITDSAIVTKGMTPDQVRAGKIYTYTVQSVASWPTFANALSRVRVWEQLDDATLDKMELLIAYYLSGNT